MIRMRIFFVVFLLPIALSCSLGGKPTYSVKHYVLEYPSPRMEGIQKINELIKVERFSVSPVFNSTAMVYRENPFGRDAYHYERWRVNPGEMVTDLVVRDLRNSGLFRAIFSYQDMEEARFLLEGQVEEFLELEEKDHWKAMLGIHITFLDQTKKDSVEKVVFQRSYRFAELFSEKTPEGLAGGMSKAMERFTRQLIRDLEKAMKEGRR
ncbi:MAG: membrane integrity-associated transporter subunit PqiC [Syntrophaceae bacterium]|nr:membrane integrity-associated transporter subunit PqiC [Syntrophaceae bacterium]